jgi:hypothetical protein
MDEALTMDNALLIVLILGVGSFALMLVFGLLWLGGLSILRVGRALKARPLDRAVRLRGKGGGRTPR